MSKVATDLIGLLLFPPLPEEIAPATHEPPDAEARARALETGRSFIVEAPAGSGKTGLLIQRFLKLLADPAVTEPEQVLALTFTIKATAEMRDRVLAQLTTANDPSQPAPTSPFDQQTRSLAQAALDRDHALGWDLLAQPHRLNLRTIDSVCAEIARTLPVLSGSGGNLTPALDAEPLYREAARRTLLLLGGSDSTLHRALRDILLHRDNNLADCESLLAEMLKLRDQWGELIPLATANNGGVLDDHFLDTHILPRLERALGDAICAGLTQLEQVFPPGILAELADLAGELGHLDGYNGGHSPIALCAGIHTSPEANAEHLDHWLALFHLLTTQVPDWRKVGGLARNHLQFDYDRKHDHHLRLSSLLDQLRHREDILEAYRRVRLLPPAIYPADQWAVAKSLFRVLNRALVELQLVFSERAECDFTEIGLLARHALADDNGLHDLGAALGSRLQHLLVDEMQDTSTSQYHLIQLLTQHWDGHSQTIFLVGDPKQSIYLFRQARVERFLQTMRTERLGDLPLTRLQLTANFRSQAALVDRFNEDFSQIFRSTSQSSAQPDAVPYTHADATLPASPHAVGLAWHTSLIPAAGSDIDATALKQQQTRAEAIEIRRIAREWLVKPLPQGRIEPWRIAVLVRSRNHLTEIVRVFRQPDATGAPIPFRAVDIEPLNERQEILDLTALTRALLHPADRVAWLALLHAPWCGLSLSDLHLLTGADDPTLKSHSIEALLAERGHLLPDESCQRIARVWRITQAAVAQRSRLTVAQLVARAWRSLGGDAWLTPIELTNANRFFQLLDTLEEPGGRLNTTALDPQLTQLYAEPPHFAETAAFVDLLTIHKAKGLEWDVVIVPAIERPPAIDRNRLLTWAELEPADSSEDGAAPIMLAPIAGKGRPSYALTCWLRSIANAREAAERKRLFYVACTRAREELHLFAAPQLSSQGEIKPLRTSLLNAAWPTAQFHFAQAELIASPTTEAGARGLASETWAPDAPANLVQMPSPSAFRLDLAASIETHFASNNPSEKNNIHNSSEVKGEALIYPQPILQRLPLAFDPTARLTNARTQSLPYGSPEAHTGSSIPTFTRPEGSFAARSFGNAVHAFLELLTQRIAAGSTPGYLLAELPTWTTRITAILRADGLPPAAADRLAARVQAALENALRDPEGLWLLAPHAYAATELALTAWQDQPTAIRVDRTFLAGPEPQAPGRTHLWIVDYKTTTHGREGLADFLASQRAAYAPQLEAYARILTQTSPEVRLALYYPTLPALAWWPLTSGENV